MKRWLMVAFALGALFDHVFYKKTKALQELNVASQHDRQGGRRLSNLTPNLPYATTVLQNSRAHYPSVERNFVSSPFGDDYIKPKLYLDKLTFDRSAYELATQFAEKWGFQASDLKEPSEARIQTKAQSVWDFSQTYDGYEVYDSSLRLLALNSSGEVLLVNDGLHPINDFSPQINYSVEQSEALLNTAYADYPVQVNLRPTAPVVWPSENAELAWVFVVNASDNSNTLRVAIGANSGKVLMSESAREADYSAFDPTFDTDCLERNDPLPNEGCMFMKNPAFSARQEFNRESIVYFGGPPYYWNTASDGTAFQNQDVVLRDLDSTGYLENNYLTILTGIGNVPRVKALKDGSWRFPYSVCVKGFCVEDPNRKYGQVSAYFWANELRHFMEDRTGQFYADGYLGVGKTTLITAQQTGTATSNYVPELREVTLFLELESQGKSKWKEEDALLAEQVMHEYGHANFAAATKIFSNDYPATTSMANYACLTAAGCLLGINEGVAFLHSSLPFNSPRIFESSTSDGNGDYDLNSSQYANKTAANFFSTVYPKGEAHTMGVLYASIWWNVRSNRCGKFMLENTDDERTLKIDKLFTEHLPWLRISDTIPTAIAKIAALAASLPGYGSSYAQAFEQELNRRYTTLQSCN